ncbi:MAG: TrmB family transcriptional regulator [Candidatus Bathyarchaeia archaeon]
MSHSEEDITTLTDFGLSASQAKVYLSLLKSTDLTAHALSEICNIVRPDVYRILVQLEELGLVQRTIDKPAKFRSVSVEKEISCLMQRRVKKEEELRRKSQALIDKYKNVQKRCYQNKEEAEYLLIPGKENQYATSEETVSRSKNSICVLGTYRRVSAWLNETLPTLEKAMSRKVTFRMILPKSEEPSCNSEPLRTLSKHPAFHLRYVSVSPAAVVGTCDREKVMISNSSDDALGTSPALWSTNKSLVGLVQDYFECLWANAEEPRRT